MEVNRIERIPLKKVWKHEAKDLTPWLCDNIDFIGESIGLSLSNAEREQSTGSFNVDIKAEDENGNTVVIENQFGSSDHDHLGKVITYLTSFNAKTAVWIVESPKQEHINAINWLNEGDNNCDFYLLTIEAVKIGDSNPAPLLTKIAAPSEESKKIGKIKKDDIERYKLRKAFWIILLEIAKKSALKSFHHISATRDGWTGASAGARGLTYVFWINQKTVRLELRIDRGKGCGEENLQILESLSKHKLNIENAFGEDLLWAELEGYRVCSIRKDYDIGGYKSDSNDWSQIATSMVESMIRLEKAIKPYIKKLSLK